MITFEMLTAAVYSLVGLAALVVALTQVFKNLFKTTKTWQNHLISFLVSLVCCGVVLFIGLHWGVGVFAAFCLACLNSWLMFLGTVIGCTGIANGLWSYEFMQKILEWIKLLPQPEKLVNNSKSEDNGEPENKE